MIFVFLFVNITNNGLKLATKKIEKQTIKQVNTAYTLICSKKSHNLPNPPILLSLVYTILQVHISRHTFFNIISMCLETQLHMPPYKNTKITHLEIGVWGVSHTKIIIHKFWGTKLLSLLGGYRNLPTIKNGHSSMFYVMKRSAEASLFL